MNRIEAVFLSLGAALLLLFLLLGAGQAQLFAGGFYVNSGQDLGNDSSYDIALADVDGDDDVDALVGNSLFNRLYLNNGSGFFSNSGQSPGLEDSRGVALGDLDGDMDPDLFVANHGAGNEVWRNEGGFFVDTGQNMSPLANSRDVALGFLDGNGTLDAFVANEGANEVWVNDGAGGFSLAQSLGAGLSHEVALGDVDGDLDLDAYVANGSAGADADELWLNDGSGSFSASGQALDTDWHEGVALGDLDGDMDLDAFLAAWVTADAVWLNDGNGSFTDSGQLLSGSGSTDVALVDVDGDEDLDAVVAKWIPDADEIWINDGAAHFTLSAETLDADATYAVQAGDLDGDTDDDLFFGNFGANHVWFRGGAPLPTAWFDVEARSNLIGQAVYPWARPEDADLPVLLSYPPAAPVDVVALIETDDGAMTQTLAFTAGQMNGTLTIDNPMPVVSATYTLTLDVETGRQQAPNGLFNPLQLVFVDEAAGDSDCALCFVDWLLKLLGFDTTFWMLHHMELTALEGTPSWNYYMAILGGNSEEISGIVARDPLLLWHTFDALETWTPAIYAYDQGQGGSVIVTQEMVDEALTVLEAIRDGANPALAAQMQLELDTLDPDSWVGLTIDDAVGDVETRISVQIFMPATIGP